MRVREWHTQPTDSMNSEQIAIAFRSREYPLKNILNCKLKWDLDGEYFVMRHRHEGCSLSTRHTQHNELTTANSANAYRIVINNPCVCARAFFLLLLLSVAVSWRYSGTWRQRDRSCVAPLLLLAPLWRVATQVLSFIIITQRTGVVVVYIYSQQLWPNLWTGANSTGGGNTHITAASYNTIH